MPLLGVRRPDAALARGGLAPLSLVTGIYGTQRWTKAVPGRPLQGDQSVNQRPQRKCVTAETATQTSDRGLADVLLLVLFHFHFLFYLYASHTFQRRHQCLVLFILRLQVKAILRPFRCLSCDANEMTFIFLQHAE